jgi:hypothetical protein
MHLYKLEPLYFSFSQLVMGHRGWSNSIALGMEKASPFGLASIAGVGLEPTTSGL